MLNKTSSGSHYAPLGWLAWCSQLGEVLIARAVLGDLLFVVGVVEETTLDAAFEHFEVSFLQRVGDVGFGVDLLHLLVDDGGLEATSVQEGETHLSLEELALRQGLLSTLLLVRLQVQLLLFLNEGVVRLQVQ